MSDRELAALFHALGKDMDARQAARIKQLRGVERKLFEELVKVLVEALDKGDGKITDRRGSVSINRLVDQIFRAIERNDLKDFYRQSMRDLSAILSNGALYAKEVKPMKPSNFLAVKRTVNRLMRKRLGLDPDTGAVKADGFLDKMFQTDAVRQEVKQVIAKAVTGGVPMGKLMRQLEVTVKGTRENPGAMEKHFRGFVLDTYQQFDRATSDEYAKRLELVDFIYQGGLIETSREFCIKRDGKTFTKDEARSEWPKDPTLPRTTKERTSGVVIDYNPLVDMGRWNCRHRCRYVSPEFAEDRRNAGGNV